MRSRLDRRETAASLRQQFLRRRGACPRTGAPGTRSVRAGAGIAPLGARAEGRLSRETALHPNAQACALGAPALRAKRGAPFAVNRDRGSTTAITQRPPPFTAEPAHA